MTYLKDREALKGFWAQYPTAKILFGEIIKVWRSAASRKVGTNGYWAAWPYPWWSERDQVTVLNSPMEFGPFGRKRTH